MISKLLYDIWIDFQVAGDFGAMLSDDQTPGWDPVCWEGNRNLVPENVVDNIIGLQRWENNSIM